MRTSDFGARASGAAASRDTAKASGAAASQDAAKASDASAIGSETSKSGRGVRTSGSPAEPSAQARPTTPASLQKTDGRCSCDRLRRTRDGSAF